MEIITYQTQFHYYRLINKTVIPKQRLIPTKQNEIEQDSIIPQWALAVIVIGAGSLLFVVIFGAAVVSKIECSNMTTFISLSAVR